MECKNCLAYGIDNLGFNGCLIKNSMLDFPSGKVGCYKRKATILRRIEDIKKHEPRAKYYKWKLSPLEVVNIMTEEQMHDRMKEIDKERYRLKIERQEYENYFSDKKRKEELNNHKNYIGKCYVSNGLKENENKFIKAFKVIDILENPNERYALCVVLIDGYRYTCWNEHGIQIMTLGLWSSNKLSLMSRDPDPKMIDFYHETTQEKFEELYRLYFESVKEKVYG